MAIDEVAYKSINISETYATRRERMGGEVGWADEQYELIANWYVVIAETQGIIGLQWIVSYM